MRKRLLTILATITLSTALLVGCENKQEVTQVTTETATVTTTLEDSTKQTKEATVTPEETAEPTPEANVEAVEEATTEPETTEPAETAEPEQTEAPTSKAVPQYTYTDMSATMYTTQIVNVRNQPSTDGEKIGSLSAEQEVQVISRCNETGWYKFIWTDGSEAYVSDKYLSDSKVEKPVASEAPSNDGGGTAGTGSVASNWADSYPKNQWIDMGEYFFYIANSQPEANQVSCDYFSNHTTGDDAHLYHTDLNARYPDRRVYTGAFPTRKGNVPVAIVSTVIYDGNGDVVYVPKFFWN